MTEQTEDEFWAQARAEDAAARGKQADPSACGTCKTQVAAGGQVKHDECAQRAVLLPAPDAPGYELITGMSEDDVAALPPRFHIPAFVEPVRAWVCAVCWGDGWSTQWPCKTAREHGLNVFTAEDYAETRAKRETAELAAYRALELGGPDGRVSASCGNPGHPTWLRVADDFRGCPWCRVAEVEGERDEFCNRVDTLTAVAQGNKRHVAALFTDLQTAQRERDEARARVAELEAELEAERERYKAGLRRADEHVNAMNEELKRYADGKETPVLWSVYNAMHLRADNAEARVTELEAEQKRYVGAEPTIADELAYLSRCLDTVHDLADLAKTRDRATVTVAELELSLNCEWQAPTPRPALPWAHAMDDGDLHGFLDDLVSAAIDRWRSEPGVPDREILAAVEKACADWRTPGQGNRSDEPGTEEGQ